MCCTLCLESLSSMPGLGFTDIFSEEGLDLDIAEIINKHFWLKVQKEPLIVQLICELCWEYLRNFHKFYESILDKHLKGKKDLEEEQKGKENVIKVDFEKEVTKEEMKFPINHVFDSEVRVKVNDLKLLPQLEIIEDTSNTNDINLGLRKEISEQKSYPTAVHNVFIKESYPADLQEENDIFAEEQLNPQQNQPKQTELVRKRGRPRKNEGLTPKFKASNLFIQQEAIDAHIISNSQSEDLPECDKKSIINGNSIDKQSADIYSTHDIEETDDDGDDDNDYDDDDESDEESEGDWLNETDTDKYAVIYKKMAVKPKKYRKHPKRIVPARRMTREQIDARKAEQARYDEIIQKFYEKMRCVKCHLLVRSFGDMRAHFRISHNDDHGYMVCCGRRFITRKALAEHVLVHWNPNHFKCPSCGKICLDAKQLQTHEKSHLPETGEPSKYKKLFQCEKCPKIFSSKASYEYHSFARHVPKEEFKFECPECKKKLPTDRKLKEHLRYTHDPQCSVICDKCGKTLRSSYSLKKHNEMEHSNVPKPPPEPQQCEICGTWLRHLSGLKQHMKSLHEDTATEHRCHICNKVSSTARALKRHIYHNHECLKKFKCTMCEKAFKRAQDLREHTSVHTGEVLYTCPNCPMTFFSNANMYKHRQRLHHAEWEADRKKPIPPNIMGQAKQGSRLRILKMTTDNLSSNSALTNAHQPQSCNNTPSN